MLRLQATQMQIFMNTSPPHRPLMEHRITVSFVKIGTTGIQDGFGDLLQKVLSLDVRLAERTVRL